MIAGCPQSERRKRARVKAALDDGRGGRFVGAAHTGGAAGGGAFAALPRPWRTLLMVYAAVGSACWRGSGWLAAEVGAGGGYSMCPVVGSTCFKKSRADDCSSGSLNALAGCTAEVKPYPGLGPDSQVKSYVPNSSGRSVTSNASPSTISVNRRVLCLSMTGKYAGVLPIARSVSVFQGTVRSELMQHVVLERMLHTLQPPGRGTLPSSEKGKAVCGVPLAKR